MVREYLQTQREQFHSTPSWLQDDHQTHDTRCTHAVRFATFRDHGLYIREHDEKTYKEFFCCKINMIPWREVSRIPFPDDYWDQIVPMPQVSLISVKDSNTHEECCICLMPLTKNAVYLPPPCTCKTPSMHRECAYKALRANHECPLCRAIIGIIRHRPARTHAPTREIEPLTERIRQLCSSFLRTNRLFLE